MANTVKVTITGDSSQLTKSANEAQKSIQRLGNESQKTSKSIKTISGAANAEKRVINELALQYHNLTDAERQAFGGDIKRQMDSHIAKLREYKAVQADINNQIGGATNSFSKFGGVVSQAGSQLGLPIGNLSALMNPTTAAIAGVAALGAAFVATAKKTEEFNSTLNDFQARLNVPKEQMKQVADDAITMGNKFGVSADSIVKQFQYMAQQAPGLEQDRDGMLALSEASNKLAIAFGVEVKDSTDAVMTVLSKFNLTASDSTEIANTLAEACRNTGADLEYQRTVFEKVGSAANASSISYQELASATGVLSSTFDDASTVGAGLNTMITKLQKAQDDYNPSVVGLTQAIKNMSDANLSYSDIVSLVGPKAAQVTKVLIDQQSAFSDLTTKMKDTQAAEEMFGVKSEELGQVINRIKTMWENFLLKIGESEVFKTVMGVISDICKWIEELSNEIQELLSQGSGLNGFAELWKQLREVINALLPVIGFVIKAFVQFYNKVYAIISDVIKFWVNLVKKITDAAKTLWNNIKAIWNAIYSKIADNAVIKSIVKAYNWLKDKITLILKKAAEAWNDFVGALGFDSLKISIGVDNSSVGEPPKTGGQTKAKDPTLQDVNGEGGVGGKGSSNKGGSGNKGNKSNANNEPDKETVEWYNKEIQKRQKMLKEEKHTDDEIKRINEEIADLTTKRNAEQQRIASQQNKQLRTIEDYEKRINELNDELKKENLSQNDQKNKLREIVSLEKQRDRIKQNQAQQKAVYELEARVTPETFKQVTDKFGDRLPLYIDLFKDAKTDKEVREIADKYQNLREIFKVPEIDPKNLQIKTPNERKREEYDNGIAALSQLQEDYNIGIIPDEEVFLEKWNAIKEQMESDGLTVEVEPELKSTKQFKQNLNDISDAVNSIGDAFGSIGDMTDDPMLKVAGIIAQAIANIALGAGQAVAKTGKMGPWGWLALGTSIMAQMAAMIAQVHSATGFAEGGIVQGSTTMGDKIVTRLNSGEMVLNRRQQSHLFNMLDNGKMYDGSNVNVTGDIKVRGSDLYLALSNHKKITHKTL